METKRARVGCILFAAACLGVLGSGLARADWQSFTAADGLPTQRVVAIAAAPDEKIWFGTPGGVGCYDGSHWTTYTRSSGLGSDDVRALIVDRAGAIWAGTAG